MAFERLLYIDDDPCALELYEDILSDEFDVTICSRPQKGVELLNKGNYDGIILDIYMPEIDGFTLYEEIKKGGKNANAPVFFISSENGVENRLRAFGLGSEDFISRDMEPVEVVARIKNR